MVMYNVHVIREYKAAEGDQSTWRVCGSTGFFFLSERHS